MPNLLIISDNLVFSADFNGQIQLYAPEFTLIDNGKMPDVIIIDEKVSLLPMLKSKNPHTPIFVFLAKGTEKPAEKPLIKYEAKPVNLAHFINSLKASPNFAANSDAGKLNFNRYELSPSNKEIINLRNHEAIKLTEKEIAILQYLYKTSNRTVGKNELLQQVWGYNPEATTHTIETHIYRLRQKVEKDDVDAQLILTEDGGYRLKK